jgi:hypothetical protein
LFVCLVQFFFVSFCCRLFHLHFLVLFSINC